MILVSCEQCLCACNHFAYNIHIVLAFRGVVKNVNRRGSNVNREGSNVNPETEKCNCFNCPGSFGFTGDPSEKFAP